MSTLTLSPASAEPGSKVDVLGRGYPPRTQILVTLGAQVVASTNTDDKGNLHTSFVVPNLTKVGQVIVRSAVASSGAAALRVVAPVPQAGDQFTYR